MGHACVVYPLSLHETHINELGCERFAAETRQPLTTFYSVDKLSADVDYNAAKMQHKNLSHTLTDHLPGKLTLCIGMPVMIKTNEATECCVTNGAEGVVVGWKSKPISEDKETLETLFVKLTAAPTIVQLEGLPENVSRKIRCKMPNGNFLSISHDQVSVIPNFAMTDFGSQGRTRPYNVCDLQNYRIHNQGTIIVQPFDAKKLTGGIAGSHRQEFRGLKHFR
ncbi:hypothetical protein GY45DRAFT_1349728 [Cubamyces sp. BRFM 1775]|nr:hypothetical protein GY45DRAFT_1349728 [Cubamyces sp. BRFM 1775]